MIRTAEAIDQHLEQNLDRVIQETAELCRIASVSARNENLVECSGRVVSMFYDHGYAVQTYLTEGAPVVVAHMAGDSDRRLLFYNHYDVQPPEPLELWTSPPFEPTIRDGALYARGSKDDKGELMARVAAVDAVKAAHGGRLPCGVLFVVEGQEEMGSPHIAQFVQGRQDLLRCHGAIWEEGGINHQGQPINTLGRRGVVDAELVVETMRSDAHSGGAHMLPSAAWRLIWALESLKGPDEQIRIPGFYDDVRPPTERDLAFFDAMPSPEEGLRELYGVEQFVAGRAGKDLNRAVFEPTCNVEGIASGYLGEGGKTIVPARAFAKLDFRLVPDQDPGDILDKLRAHLDAQGFADVQIIGATRGAIWPWRTDPDDPLVALNAETAEEVYGMPAVTLPMTGGSSPVYAFARPLGIPVISPGVGYPGSRTHAPDEHVRLDHFLNAARHIARILERFANLPGKS